jgi:shikimate kinase
MLGQDDVIVVIGDGASGKSNIAKRLACELGWDLVELDVEFEEFVGMTIGKFFDQEGERLFRDIETIRLEPALRRRRTILSPGGGIGMRLANRELLKGRTVGFVNVGVEIRIARAQKQFVEKGIDRPKMRDPVLARQIHVEREPIYRAMATFTVEINEELHKEEAFQRFFAELKKYRTLLVT